MRTLRRIALVAALLAPLGVGTAAAQTPEGTVITNTATATWSDANSNTYTSTTASVNVTVGFLAAPDATSPATGTPASASTGNELNFTITNKGNGIDQFSAAVTAGAGLTVTGYKIGATTYATLAELNTALAATNVAAAGTVVVTVVYTVAAGRGGQASDLTLTASSVRTPATSDAATTTLTPPVSAGINTTPDGATVSRLPSNGTSYTATYTVTNNGSASDVISLAAVAGTPAVLSITSVNGTAGSAGTITLAAGASGTVDVIYTIANGAAAGATSALTLTATSGNTATVSDAGDVTVTVIRAAIAMTKEAFRDNQTTAVTGTVLPGEYIQYRITVTNNGAAAASTVSVSDPLPAQVTYTSTSGDAAGWTISEAGGTVTAALTGSLAPAASRFFWIRVQIK